MHARVIQFNVSPGSRAVIEESTKVMDSLVKAQPGYQGVTYYGDDETGEYGCMLLWDSVESADKGAEALRPQLVELLGGMFQGTPSFKLYEVFEV